MPKKRKKRPESAAEPLLLLECPICADSVIPTTFESAGKFKLHLMKDHTVAQLATEILRAVLDSVRPKSVAKIEDGSVKVVEAVKPSADHCRDDVCDNEEEPKENVSKAEEGVKKESSSRRRFVGPFKCTDCGKILSSKVILYSGNR